MNRHAQEYKWTIDGFGDPIVSSGSSTSHFFPFDKNYREGLLYSVFLMTTGQSGCRDTLIQDVFSGKQYTRASDFARPLPFSIYPNPFWQQIKVELPPLNGELAAFSLYNTLGQLIISMDKINTTQFTVQCPPLPAGYYYYRVSVGSNLIGSGKLLTW
jgi:hypothetical protein